MIGNGYIVGIPGFRIRGPYYGPMGWMTESLSQRLHVGVRYIHGPSYHNFGVYVVHNTAAWSRSECPNTECISKAITMSPRMNTIYTPHV